MPRILGRISHKCNKKNKNKPDTSMHVASIRDRKQDRGILLSSLGNPPMSKVYTVSSEVKEIDYIRLFVSEITNRWA